MVSSSNNNNEDSNSVTNSNSNNNNNNKSTSNSSTTSTTTKKKRNSSNSKSNNSNSVCDYNKPDANHNVGHDSIKLSSLRKESYHLLPTLKALCDQNGINEDFFTMRAHSIHHIELFMTSRIDISLIRFFYNIQSLTIMRQYDVVEILGLEECPLLTDICITECNLSKISGLTECKNLTKLNLSSNKITSLDKALISNVKIETLWLNNNQITHLHGLETLSNLKTLWICRNQIESIGKALQYNYSLKELNIADNRIGCFKEVLHLANLKSLHSLALIDPHFGSNPICNLCNYQTLVMFHLTQLKEMDMRKVGDESKSLAQSIYTKKKMYYNMRIKTLKRNASNLVRMASALLHKKTIYWMDALTELLRKLKDIEAALEEAKIFYSREHLEKDGDLNFMDDDEHDISSITQKSEKSTWTILEEKRVVLTRIRNIIENKMMTMETSLENTRKTVFDLGQRMCLNLMLEFNTGGNIRLEEGSEREPWYRNFKEFVNSSFNTKKYGQYGISGVEINRIVRIHNRFLRQRLEHQVQEVMRNINNNNNTNSSSSTGKTPYKRPKVKKTSDVLEYLFFRVTDELSEKTGDGILSIAENGFRYPSEYSQLGMHGSILLATSLEEADLERIEEKSRQMKNRQEKDVLDHALCGQLLIVKVYRGRSTEIDLPTDSNGNPESRINACDYPNYQSACMKSQGRVHNKKWYIFDRALAVPEFIIDFEYIKKSEKEAFAGEQKLVVEERLRSLRQLASMNGNALGPIEEHMSDVRPFIFPVLRFARKVEVCLQSCLAAYLSEKDRALQFELPNLLEKTKAEEITEGLLKERSKVNVVEDITYLNLHGNKIRKIENMMNCLNLKTLILSFNNIESTNGLDLLHSLEKLDLSFNKIRHLSGLPCLPKLQYFDISANWIEYVDGFMNLTTTLPGLLTLDLRHNPLRKIKNYRITVLRDMEQLKCLDGVIVTQKERSKVCRFNRCLSIDEIKRYATKSRPKTDRSLSQHDNSNDNNGDGVLAKSSNRYLQAGDNDTEFFNTIEELRLNNYGLQKIQNLERLVNVRYISFAHNDLSRIECLSFCRNLEELSLEDNRIDHIENLDELIHLKKLDLGNNRLQRMVNLDNLIHLTQLSLENNQIVSLKGLANLQSLMEIYIGNNNISETIELEYIKSLPRLIILDLSGNPICRDPNYREYTIFRLKWLKVLDGKPVSSKEVSESKEKYYGKMTRDFLIEKIGPCVYEDIESLDLSGCRLRDVDMFRDANFNKLKNLNLDHNSISYLSWIIGLTSLTDLSIQNNRIESFGGINGRPNKVLTTSSVKRCFELRKLNLNSNRVSDARDLSLYHFPNLNTLDLQNNGISQIHGLSTCAELRVLNLNRNKIRQIEPNSFIGLVHLKELYIEENGLRTLGHIGNLPNVTKIYLGANRVTDLSEFEKLGNGNVIFPMELKLSGNPVCRKPRYRASLVYYFKSLRIIDGRTISEDERERSAALVETDTSRSTRYYAEFRNLQYEAYQMSGANNVYSNTSKVPIKITSMNFGEQLTGNHSTNMTKIVHQSPGVVIPDVRVNAHGRKLNIEQRERVKMINGTIFK